MAKQILNKFVQQILLLHINMTHDKLIIYFCVINWSYVLERMYSHLARK